MTMRACLTAAIVLAIPGISASGWAAELRRETIEAFDQYVAAAEARFEPRYKGVRFLWSDGLTRRIQQLQKGAILIEPAQGSGTVEIKGGMIQDWIGAVFVASASLAKVLSVLQDYSHHKDIYKPDVVEAQVRARRGNDFSVYIRFIKSKLFLSSVLNTEHEIHYVLLDSSHAYSRAYSVRIAEVSEPGTPKEHELPVGKDRGLLWRMYGYWFFEERDGGVYIECESVTLTRDVPFGMGKLVAPIVRGVPVESMRKSLDLTRTAVLNR